MTRGNGIVVAKGFEAEVGVLRTEPEALDEIISQGVRDGCLAIAG